MDSRTKKILQALSVLPLAAMPAAHGAMLSPVAQDAGTWSFHNEQVLGTSLQVTVRCADAASAATAEAAVLAVFDRENAVLSAWQSESEFSRWSRTRLEAVPVSEELFSTLAAFDAWRERTDGALDPSVEAATRLWKRATAEGRTPTRQEIAETVEAIAQPHWSLDAASRTAMRLSDVPLALASFAKSRIAAKAADAALAAGASGVMLNVGGDVVVRGAMTQMVAVADPQADAENDAALDHVVVSNAAVATSGGYRRGFDVTNGAAAKAPAYSHLIDPRTAQPVSHILSSTVIARDAETAGALATAFSVMPVEASRRLAQATPGAEYLIVAANGRAYTSAGWTRYQVPGGSHASLQAAAFVPTVKAVSGVWDPAFELSLEINLPRIDDARYRRPYVAVWIEDADHFPVRTLTLWTQNARWLPELKQWYRGDQIRNLSEGTDISRTVSSATRPPGKYSLKWDGKDNDGKPVKAGTYSVVIEASREHGGYQIDRKAISFTGKPDQATLPGGQELGSVVLDYRKR
jgi:thiamine biosynthesis lipoprotein